MDIIEERTKQLLNLLRANGFDIERNEWEDCGSGERYESYNVIDCQNDNIELTGSGYTYNNMFPELKNALKTQMINQ